MILYIEVKEVLRIYRDKSLSIIKRVSQGFFNLKTTDILN